MRMDQSGISVHNLTSASMKRTNFRVNFCSSFCLKFSVQKGMRKTQICKYDEEYFVMTDTLYH